MKLAIDASRLEPTAKTGVEYYSYWLIKELIKVIPIEVEVILYSRREISGILEKLPTNWQVKVLTWPPKFLWSQLRLAWQVNHDRPDVLFIPSHILPFLIKAPTVVTIHDISWRFSPKSYSVQSRWYLRFTTWWTARRAKAVLAVSQYTKDNLEQYYPRLVNKVFVTPLGPTLPEFQGQSIKEDYFLVIGRVETKKNLSMLFRAYADFVSQNKDGKIELYLTGSMGRGAEKLLAEVKQLQLTDQVKLFGWLDEQQLAKYLAGTKALLFPGNLEGFGLPVLDAWAAGVPVVAARAGALPEVLGEAGVLLDPQEMKVWAQTMRIILDNNELRNKLISLGKARLQEFGWRKTAQITWQVLKKLETRR